MRTLSSEVVLVNGNEKEKKEANSVLMQKLTRNRSVLRFEQRPFLADAKYGLAFYDYLDTDKHEVKDSPGNGTRAGGSMAMVNKGCC